MPRKEKERVKSLIVTALAILMISSAFTVLVSTARATYVEPIPVKDAAEPKNHQCRD
jgi:hypothetical protein